MPVRLLGDLTEEGCLVAAIAYQLPATDSIRETVGCHVALSLECSAHYTPSEAAWHHDEQKRGAHQCFGASGVRRGRQFCCPGGQ